ncbi:hypothetical protein Tco_0224059 [Tanacetum coccineum]
MIFCTIKSKPLALPWGQTPRLDSGVRVLSSLKDKGFQLFKVGADADEDRITELIASAEKKLASFRFGGAPAKNFLENVEYDDVRHGIQSIRLRDK